MKGEGWWISNIQVPKDLRDLLEPILNSRNVRTLILDRNEFGDHQGVGFLCSIIEKNPYLKRVSFHNNLMEDMNDIRRFCGAVSKHSSLEHLTLENVGLDGDEDKLSLVLDATSRGSVECLGLSGNGLGSRDAAELICRFLSENNSLKIMYLRDNNFDDEASDLFTSALQDNNTHLRVLDLSDNHFTKAGRMTVHNALFDTSSLDAAFDSNHSCVVYINEPELKDKLGAINCKGTPQENLHKKIYSILYSTTDIGSLLNGVPLSIMPEVLGYLQDFYPKDITRGVRRHAMESLQLYSKDDFDKVFSLKTPLTLMYEVLRTWSLPSLFTNV